MNKLEAHKKIFGDLRNFARQSRVKRVKDMHGPKPMHTGAPSVHISIGHESVPEKSLFDGMSEEELSGLTGPGTKHDDEEADE